MELEQGVGSDLAGQLRLSVVRLNRRLRSQRTDETVSLTQISAMATLNRCGPMTPSELAASERVRPPSMTRVIAALEEEGMVSRRDHPTDGRQSIIELSPAGAELLAAEASAKERWLDKRLAELTEAERVTLARATEIIDRMAGA
ncbi:MAG TPA: MarR family transcriptional regulator [Pseudonocardia sp.]|uniref:MarR family winged helix-turn-helix transcriptional regulator n=1 Tax=Pseudonocardia sp. TaxID=60912 RepID=UPI002D115974|nr:MarR family transcriptional regulator [Pseudonocardia sp.]HTF47788.1 MarR family transcriptional regulator [Pseudonocardia sp.]